MGVNAFGYAVNAVVNAAVHACFAAVDVAMLLWYRDGLEEAEKCRS